jgi:hypothetical protein
MYLSMLDAMLDAMLEQCFKQRVPFFHLLLCLSLGVQSTYRLPVSSYALAVAKVAAWAGRLGDRGEIVLDLSMPKIDGLAIKNALSGRAYDTFGAECHSRVLTFGSLHWQTDPHRGPYAQLRIH